MKNLKTYNHKGAIFYAIFDENDNFIERNADKEKLLNKYPSAKITEDTIELRGKNNKMKKYHKSRNNHEGRDLPIYWRGKNGRKLGYNIGKAPRKITRN